jgi:hypothetical protein
MPIADREWSKVPAPDEKLKSPVEGSDTWELTMTGTGFRAERADPKPVLGWKDLFFWFFLIMVTRRFTG